MPNDLCSFYPPLPMVEPGWSDYALGAYVTATVVILQRLRAVYLPDVDSLRGGTTPLDQVDTVSYADNSLFEIIIDQGAGEEELTFKLKTGTADPSDPTGQVHAYNSDSTADERYFLKVG